MVSVAVIAADGPTGAAIIVQRIMSEQLKEIAQRLIKPLQLSGFYGLDFMIEEKTGTPYLIEMNPRCTQLGHLEFPDQCSLAGSLRCRPARRPQTLGGESGAPREDCLLSTSHSHTRRARPACRCQLYGRAEGSAGFSTRTQDGPLAATAVARSAVSRVSAAYSDQHRSNSETSGRPTGRLSKPTTFSPRSATSQFRQPNCSRLIESSC